MRRMDAEYLLRVMTGKDVSLYPYQKRMVQAISMGKNVVALAPTGSGKTWGAVLPFIRSMLLGTPIADRLLYALPLRTLASSLHKSTVGAVGRLEAALATMNGWPDRLPFEVSIQTGEQQDDPYYESRICFTTIDQLISAYLNIPVSLGPGLANINAGALIGALIVFDEIHLLDRKRAGATILEMADRLRYCSQFVLMTATLGEETARIIAGHLDAEVVEVGRDELQLMESHRTKCRRYTWVGRQLSAGEVADAHVRLLEKKEDARTVVICNTVSRAQETYLELSKRLPSSTKLALLHSRFTRPDRMRGEDTLIRHFGPEASQGNAVLVTTQVVEAGIDISADELHTELSPANSLIQRAGRCARYPEPRNRGTVYIYALPLASNGQPRRGPYFGNEDSEAMAKTVHVVERLPSEGKVWDYGDEKNLIEQVHGAYDSLTTTATINHLAARSRHVNEVVQSNDRYAAHALIRDVDSVTVFVSDQPQEIRLSDRPYLVSIPRESLYSLSAISGPLGWIPREGDAESDTFSWVGVQSPKQFGSAWMVCLSPAVASYNPQVGLRLGVPGCGQSMEYRGRHPWQRFAYRAESYVDHVDHVLAQYAATESVRAVALGRLGSMYRVSAEQVQWLAALSCTLHDAGKLTRAWQDVARRWQRDRHPDIPLASEALLAHTTFDPETDAHESREPRYRLPPHALEGAAMVAEGLYEAFCTFGWSTETSEDMTKVISTVISRHHSPRACTLESPVMPACGALAQINRILARISPSFQFNCLATLESKGQAAEFTDNVIVSAVGSPHLIVLYWYLVRQVRLADQKSFGTYTGRKEVKKT